MSIRVITPETGFHLITRNDIKELYDYRELLFFLIWRDIKTRYKQTKAGLAWLIFQPLLSMVIFTIFFGLILKIKANQPYPLFFLSAYIVWILFYEGVIRSTYCIISNASIVTQVYVPKLIFPLASIISPLIDFTISLGILIVLMILFGYVPTIGIVYLPLIIIYVTILSSGVGLWIATLNMQFRDFQYFIPYLLQLWSYCSPLVYPQSLVPLQYQFYYNLNPISWMINEMRYIMFGIQEFGSTLFPSIVITFVIFATGLLYFKQFEKGMVDMI